MNNQQLLEKIFTSNDSRESQQVVEALRSLGTTQQRQVSKQQQLFAQPMSGLVHNAGHQSELSLALRSLTTISQQLKPSQLSSQRGLWGKITRLFSKKNHSFIEWFESYQRISPELISTIKQLHNGRDQLKRDNITLLDDKLQMETAANNLELALEQSKSLLSDIKQRLITITTLNEKQQHFIKSELVKIVEQRIVDLQSQSIVAQQSLLTTDLLVNNNEELIRGISHSINTTLATISTANNIALGVRQQTDAIADLSTINRNSKKIVKQLQDALNNKTLDDQAITSTMNNLLNDIDKTLGEINSLQENQSDR